MYGIKYSCLTPHPHPSLKKNHWWFMTNTGLAVFWMYIGIWWKDIVLTLSVYIHISVVRSESSYKLDPEMSVLLEIRIERASKTLHPGDIVKGVVAITSKSALKVSLGSKWTIWHWPACYSQFCKVSKKYLPWGAFYIKL